MKIEIGKKYKNWLTDVEVTVTGITPFVAMVKLDGIKVEHQFNTISYNRDYASPSGTTATGEYIDGGTIDNIKPEYVFKRTYVPVK